MTSHGSTSEYPVYQSSIHYTDPAGRLQTYDIWLPRPLEQSDPSDTIWILYVHGGAWRDPAQDSKCIKPTIEKLQNSHSKTVDSIAGIASINYRLSPYTSHLKDPSDPDDPQRNIQHPKHAQDVRTAINYITAKYNIKRYIAIGHSCGATLLLQLLLGGMKNIETPPPQPLPGQPCPKHFAKPTKPCLTLGPEAVILLEGIYDIKLLITNHSPPSCPENIAQIYRDIVLGAFGEDFLEEGDVANWLVSPACYGYDERLWQEGRLIVLGYSKEDGLVEAEQGEVMKRTLEAYKWGNQGKRILVCKDLEGEHDAIWEDGGQIAALIEKVTKSFYVG